MLETFNSYIFGARRLPLIDMLERIRRLLMARQVQKNKLFSRSTDLICPVVRRDIESMKKEVASKYIAMPSLMDRYGVSKNVYEKERYVVELSRARCSCKYWA